MFHELPSAPGPRPKPFAVSVILHATAFSLAVFGPAPGPAKKPKSVYEQVFAPNEKKLVWYRLNSKLPEVSPLERRGISQPPRAESKVAQTIVSSPKDGARNRQMTWTPSPRVNIQPELKAPNLLAFEAPKLPPAPVRPAPKLFVPPDVVRPPEPRAELPAAPKIETAALDPNHPLASMPRPSPRPFRAPDPPRINRPSTALPAAPEVRQPAPADPADPDNSLLRMARPQPRTFTPPPQRTRSQPETSLPAAPPVQAAATLDPNNPLVKIARLQPRAFTLPSARSSGGTPAPIVPAAPAVQAAAAFDPNHPLAKIARPQPRAFTPPSARSPGVTPLPIVPAASAVQAAAAFDPNHPLAKIARPQPRAFTPPSIARGSGGQAPVAGDAPALSAQLAPGGALVLEDPSSKLPGRPAKAFVPPSSLRSVPIGPGPPAADLEAPIVAPEGAQLSAAVIGLNPSTRPVPLLPEGSRPASLSAGPRISGKGGAGEPVESARIFIPDLMVRNSSSDKASARETNPVLMARVAPTSREALLAVARASAALPAPMIAVRPAPSTTSSFDPRLKGRIIYTLAIQMPNVTSYSGSWTLWFADREPPFGESSGLRAPSPLRKVDPVYALSAIDDRIEGNVKLAAVIRKDGRVDSIALVRGIDERLDRSAIAALGKWEFEPARRDGEPVDIDAVVEIPFRLAPKVP